MAQDPTLIITLNKLYDTLDELSVRELETLAAQWMAVKDYAGRVDGQQTLFYGKLVEAVGQSPTLAEHGFAEVLSQSSRFSPEPAPNHNQPTSTQGMPAVHNEIIKIADKIDELIANSQSKK